MLRSIALLSVALTSCAPRSVPGVPELLATSVTRGAGPNGEHLVVLDVDDVPSSLAIEGQEFDATTTRSFDFERYARVGDREAVVGRLTSRLAAAFADFDVEVSSKPTKGAHTTCAIVRTSNGRASGTGALGGASPIDCDNQDESDTVFVREPSDWIGERGGMALERELDRLAVSCAHELGHSFGLSHSFDPNDVMQFTSNESARFVPGPRETYATGGCRLQLRGRQDTHAALDQTLGVHGEPAGVRFVISSPEQIGLPEPWSLSATAEPASRIRRMFVVDRAQVLATSSGSTIHISARPHAVGRQVLTIVAETLDGRRARTTVSVRVVEGGEPLSSER